MSNIENSGNADPYAGLAQDVKDRVRLWLDHLRDGEVPLLASDFEQLRQRMDQVPDLGEILLREAVARDQQPAPSTSDTAYTD